MKRSAMLRVTGLLLTALVSTVAAQSETPYPIDVSRLNWTSPPPVPGLQFAWVLGNEQNEGMYALRVKLEKGTKIPPHTHPDERNSTVLKGTLYVGFGERFDPARLVAVPEGSVYVAPARVPHYLYARDGDVEYQEAGVGPTGTKILK